MSFKPPSWRFESFATDITYVETLFSPLITEQVQRASLGQLHMQIELSAARRRGW